LQEYVLIEQERVEVEVFRRSQGWQPSYYYWDDIVELESVGLSLSVQAIYEQVKNGDVEELLQKTDEP
jgi:Uma2 family endonuclease